MNPRSAVSAVSCPRRPAAGAGAWRSACSLAAIFAGALSISAAATAPAAPTPSPAQPIIGSAERHPHGPLGTPRGVMPGRVAWAWDPTACRWDEKSGAWWADENTDQGKVDVMASKAVQCITNTTSDAAAWNALFKYFRQEHGQPAAGYKAGEKIAIKINLNNDRTSYDDTPWINTSPQSINAILRQLTRSAGVREEDITVYDATRYITPHLYNHVHNAFPGVKLVDGYGGLPGRIKTTYTPDRIHYAKKTEMGSGVATCAVEATYLINIYVAKGHPAAGVTLSGKNHYGSVDGREHMYVKGKVVGYDTYNPLVDLLGHQDLGGKTILNVCDMLYGCYHSDASPIKWKSAPFNGNWPASLLVSQDPIANDSVATDFLVTEFVPRTDIPEGVNVKGKKIDMTNCDAVLHDAAQADHPPAGIVYAPNGDGVKLKSLGVHEHWNNAAEKKYSGAGKGIDLVPIVLNAPAKP